MHGQLERRMLVGTRFTTSRQKYHMLSGIQYPITLLPVRVALAFHLPPSQDTPPHEIYIIYTLYVFTPSPL